MIKLSWAERYKDICKQCGKDYTSIYDCFWDYIMDQEKEINERWNDKNLEDYKP